MSLISIFIEICYLSLIFIVFVYHMQIHNVLFAVVTEKGDRSWQVGHEMEFIEYQQLDHYRPQVKLV